MKQIFVVTGPTATGKTQYALDLAKEHHGELVNADARQIYKELDIVTGKDIKNVWLYDIVDPTTVFSSMDYVAACIPVLKDILHQGKTPILVGGTYYYLKHLLYNTPASAVEPHWELRTQLERKTVPELQDLLKTKAPDIFTSMNLSDQSNPRRLIRRLELLETHGEVPPAPQTDTITLGDKLGEPDIKITVIGLYRENRVETRAVIERRVKKRITDGAIEETKRILEKYPASAPGLQSIGYPQIQQYLSGSLSENQLIETWTNKEYQYAKRQYTFMKADPHISWINIP